ncbi:hypothetical protein DCCM_0557 [Desulfocucumis palustris]|uniref:Uncharacterized protein n=1 Tax=Desulfocucumis palustris TaxID=1898651 RepID=A0A2L2X9S8_9FIRM|nr:hypothetical protein DCCM_0557 [Desulfocucumis palustris]
MIPFNSIRGPHNNIRYLDAAFQVGISVLSVPVRVYAKAVFAGVRA